MFNIICTLLIFLRILKTCTSMYIRSEFYSEDKSESSNSEPIN